MSETDSNRLQPPAHLLADVPAAVRDALAHPYRRQILRTLQGETVRLSPAELTESGPVPCSLSYAAYHLQVLADCGLAEGVEPEPPAGEAARRYSSRLADDSPVLAVLRDTDQSDQLHFTLAA